MTTSTSGTITSRTVVSPRSKILSIISASSALTEASPGSSCSSAFSSSRETNCRVSGCGPPNTFSTRLTTALASATNGASSREIHLSGRYRRRIRLVAHSRATALGMISPKTSITGVTVPAATSHAQPPSRGSSANVTAEPATMWAIVTPIIAADSSRSGRRNDSRYSSAMALPSSARWRRRSRLAAMNAISAAEKNIVATRQAAASQMRLMPPPRSTPASSARSGPRARACARPSPR